MSTRYYTLKDYLVKRFGGRVQRVTLEGGFTCPNIDGTKSVGGCTFCTDDGSSSGAQNGAFNIREQLRQGIEKQSKRFDTDKFIAYFQSFTNTYGEINYLRSLYDQAIDHPQVKVLAIGTRPDCVSEEVIDLLEEYTRLPRHCEDTSKRSEDVDEAIQNNLEVWVDIGVQTSHNQTLEKINRAHSFEEFLDTANRLARRKNPLLRICTHVILGLPGETPEMMYETAEKLSASPIHDIKIHQLCVFHGTAMEIDHLNGELKTFATMDEYIPVLAEFISRLRPDIAIQRLMGEGKVGEIIAPDWADTHKHSGNKNLFISKFNQYLEEKDIRQGSKLKLSSLN